MTPDTLPFPQPDPWTAATWRQAVEALPVGWEGTAWGALGRMAARWGLLVKVGYQQSRRPGSRGSAVARWRRTVPGEQREAS